MAFCCTDTAMSSFAFTAKKLCTLLTSVARITGRTNTTLDSRCRLFYFDEINQVTSYVVTWTISVHVINEVFGFAGWTLQLIVNFGLVEAVEAERVKTREKPSMLVFILELIITLMTLEKHFWKLVLHSCCRLCHCDGNEGKTPTLIRMSTCSLNSFDLPTISFSN